MSTTIIALFVLITIVLLITIMLFVNTTRKLAEERSERAKEISKLKAENNELFRMVIISDSRINTLNVELAAVANTARGLT